MSEPVLKAIIQLFALVAKEDGITSQERKHIRVFLMDRLNPQAAVEKLVLFNHYVQLYSQNSTPGQEFETIELICTAINKEIAQKQKIVVMLKLMSIILADGTISPRESKIALTIGKALKVPHEERELMKIFLSGKTPDELDHERILIIDNQPGGDNKYRHIPSRGVHGFIAFMYIQSVKMLFFKHLGKTNILLNGVPKNPDSVDVFAVGSTLRWDRAKPIYYRDVMVQFKGQEGNQKLSCHVEHVSYTFKDGNVGLRNINLYEESGSLIAIMGSSGSGKSTLLYVLNGMLAPSSGQVCINGINVHKEADHLKGAIAFVPQEDMLIEDLTVYQNLYFAAQFSCHKLSKKQLVRLVEETLEKIGLWDIRNSRIGSSLQQVISGGQRKRLNIGLELLREPDILFCDEPTSGLSSRDSEHILDLLKELTIKGKIVFTVVHQPSSDMFKMFDKLIILDTGGYQIYYGNPIEAVTYFKRSINAIDSSEEECIQCGRVKPEQIFNIIDTKIIDEYGNFSNERKFTPKDWAEKYAENTVQEKTVNTSKEKPCSMLSVPPWLKQVKLFFMRDVLAKIRNTQYVLINLLEAPILAFILASIVKFYNPDSPHHNQYSFAENINIPSYLFMSIIVALFMGLTVSAEEIIRDSKIIKREAFLQLSRGAYLSSKILILFIISAVQSLLYVWIGHTMLEIEGMTGPHWLILFSTFCFANLLGLNISSAFNSAVTIYILIPILLIPQLILSGAVVRFDKLNPIIGELKNVPTIGNTMASRWAFEAAMVTQFKDNDYEKVFYAVDKRIATAEYYQKQYITYLEHILNRLDQSSKELKADFTLLRNELQKALDKTRYEGFSSMHKLYAKKYDLQARIDTENFIAFLKRYYADQYRKALQDKQDLIQAKTNTPKKKKAFEKLKATHQNKAVAAWVQNLNDPRQILREDNTLIQKIFPIYQDPEPDNMTDFNAPFYIPKKHFLNRNIDTLTFNVGIIWAMTLMLCITLYFNVLYHIVKGLGIFSSLMPKRM